jgi:hypothetical protein
MMKTLKSRELTSEKDGGRKEGAARSRDFMCSYSCSDLASSAFKRGYPLPSLHKNTPFIHSSQHRDEEVSVFSIVLAGPAYLNWG